MHNLQHYPNREGFLLINKPRGKTSFFLVKVLRKITGIQKIGHCGTLDPFATGVMVMLIGRSYTRLANTFLAEDKQYLATMRLGCTSNTYDSDGIITKVSSYEPTLQEIEHSLHTFQGEIDQVPPMFSAKKIAGQKLYELARKNIEIERPAKKVKVEIELVDYRYPFVTLKVTCSKGTYIRSLAHDIGQNLQVGAYLNELIRLRSGEFYLEDCLDFDTILNADFNYTTHLKGLACRSSILSKI